MQQQEAARKREEKTRMDVLKCATDKKFRHLCRTKSVDEKLFKEQKTVEQHTVELTTFHPEASSGKGNERKYEKAHEFMEKKYVTAKYEKLVTAKCEKYKSDKSQ